MNYQPRSMLITGGAGFIGANFVRHVLTSEPSINIVNLDKLTYAGSLTNLQDLPNEERYQFIQGDIADKELIHHVLTKHQIDTIVHFAAESHVDRSIVSPTAFIDTNLVGTFVLLDAARKYWLQYNKLDATACRFHHISTDEVYGSLALDGPCFTEKTAYQPRSPYSASKAGSDHLVNAYHHTYGLPTVISHCSNNYGPFQHPEKFIPTIIRSCLNWQPIPIYGNGHNIRDWLYVEDHCRGIMQLIKKAKLGESYNMGGENEWENLALARYICDQLDILYPAKASYQTLLTFVTDRLGHDFRYSIDISKIKGELNWSPLETLETGIKKTIAFYANMFQMAKSA